jgi:hypothetical protein
MASVTQDVPIYRYGTQDGNQPLGLPEKASASIYVGTIAVTQSGYAKDAASSAASTDVCWGVYNGTYDSQPHTAAPMAGGTTDGLHTVGVDTGIFLLNNATGPDAIAQANIGSACYIYDNVTVALTNSTGSRAVAGTVFAVASSTGVGAVSSGSNTMYTNKVAVRMGVDLPGAAHGPGTGS